MNLTSLVRIAALIAASTVSSLALTTQEIVNQSMPSVVAIISANATTQQAGEATGWFITPNRIVTNSHVVSGEFNVIKSITNCGTGVTYTVDHISYNHVANDMAVITVRESNPTILKLSSLKPEQGMPIVVIGNPEEQYGKVLTGTLGETILSGVSVNDHGTAVVAQIEHGSSGSPVLDPNGDVISMIWGVYKGVGLGISVQTLQLAQLDTIEFNYAVNPPQPAPAPENQAPSSPRLQTTKRYGKSRKLGNATLVEVLDSESIAAISAPLIQYFVNNNQNNAVANVSLFMSDLDQFFDQNNISYDKAAQIDAAYRERWPYQYTEVDFNKLHVEQVNGENIYLVTCYINWHVQNGSKRKSGLATTLAAVQPRWHELTKRPDYFIKAIWNQK
jgi:S1-C subfamily serine protease